MIEEVFKQYGERSQLEPKAFSWGAGAETKRSDLYLSSL